MKLNEQDIEHWIKEAELQYVEAKVGMTKLTCNTTTKSVAAGKSRCNANPARAKANFSSSCLLIGVRK